MSYLTLILALIAVESGGKADAVGDNGRAYGILQIHLEVVLDVNRVYGTSYRWPQDALQPLKAQRICELYLTHWAKVRFAGQPTYEQAARIWNGGPNGHRRSATLGYWAKVQKHLP